MIKRQYIVKNSIFQASEKIFIFKFYFTFQSRSNKVRPPEHIYESICNADLYIIVIDHRRIMYTVCSKIRYYHFGIDLYICRRE